MSESFNVEDLENNAEEGNFEDIVSPYLYPPLNPSPNVSSGVIDGQLLLQTEPAQEDLREDPFTNNFEDESIIPIPSEMPSLLLRPTETTDLDGTDSVDMTKGGDYEPMNQFEEEDENSNAKEEKDLNETDDTVTSPHPASQVEMENNQLARLTELMKEQGNPDSERTSNFRQRVTPMPSDPAEDTRGPNMVSQVQYIIMETESRKYQR